MTSALTLWSGGRNRANLLALSGLSSLVLMQPLLALLAQQTEFLVVHRAGPADVLALVVGLAVVPPLLLFAAETAAGWVGLGRVLHVGFVGLLTATIAFLSLAHIEELPGAAALGCATVSGVLGHSSPAVTMRTYAHALPSRKREAAARVDAIYGG